MNEPMISNPKSTPPIKKIIGEKSLNKSLIAAVVLATAFVGKEIIVFIKIKKPITGRVRAVFGRGRFSA